MKRTIQSYRDLLLLTAAAAVIGAVMGLIDTAFGYSLILITNLRQAHPYFWIPLLGFAGILLVWCCQRFGCARLGGMAQLFRAGQGGEEAIPLQTAPLVMGGTWLTHLFGGSAGREGAAMQIGGVLAYHAGKRLPVADAPRLLLLAGMAAGFAGLLHTPIAATILVLEMLTFGALEYAALLPALVAAYLASLISSKLGLVTLAFQIAPDMVFSWLTIVKLSVLGISCGIVGCVFSVSLRKLTNILRRRLPNPYVRIFAGGVLLSIAMVICWGGRYSGAGLDLMAWSLTDQGYPFDFLLKLLLTILTLAVGFQGGGLLPLLAIGAAFGAFFGSILGLPADFAAAMACAAVFASATNTLIAPFLIGVELFGFQYAPYFFLVCVLANTFNANRSIFTQQTIRRGCNPLQADCTADASFGSKQKGSVELE